MAIFSSQSARGFYDDAINTVIPADAVEISRELHAEIIAGPGNGKLIEWRDDSIPFLIDRPMPSTTEMAAIERLWRDGELDATEWLRNRHRDQLDLGVTTTLSGEQFTELLQYLQALRDWPAVEAFPDSAQRPVAPPWIAEQTQ